MWNLKNASYVFKKLKNLLHFISDALFLILSNTLSQSEHFFLIKQKWTHICLHSFSISCFNTLLFDKKMRGYCLNKNFCHIFTSNKYINRRICDNSENRHWKRHFVKKIYPVNWSVNYFVKNIAIFFLRREKKTCSIYHCRWLIWVFFVYYSAPQQTQNKHKYLVRHVF